MGLDANKISEVTRGIQTAPTKGMREDGNRVEYGEMDAKQQSTFRKRERLHKQTTKSRFALLKRSNRTSWLLDGKRRGKGEGGSTGSGPPSSFEDSCPARCHPLTKRLPAVQSSSGICFVPASGQGLRCTGRLARPRLALALALPTRLAAQWAGALLVDGWPRGGWLNRSREAAAYPSTNGALSLATGHDVYHVGL